MKNYRPVLSLRPTQFSVGLYEVAHKADTLLAMGKRKRRKFIDENPIPVVISPKGHCYLIDHHHFLFACQLAEVPEVKIDVIKDYSAKTKHRKMSYLMFWRVMHAKKWTYLYDQFGDGPRQALYLPLDVRGMADDPYRSLAWLVRQQGGYENSTKTFFEFEWANFFRSQKLLDQHGREALNSATKKAVKLARSPAACKLPGFTG